MVSPTVMLSPVQILKDWVVRLVGFTVRFVVIALSHPSVVLKVFR